MEIGNQFPEIGSRKLDFQLPASNSKKLEFGSWKLTFNFRKLEAGSWILNLRHLTSGSPKLYSNFWELGVGLEGAISDHPPQYFFHAKKCVKTRKNGSFRGGKPPGRNARENPWGPVRTRGDPRPLLGSFATGFVVVSDKYP